MFAYCKSSDADVGRVILLDEIPSLRRPAALFVQKIGLTMICTLLAGFIELNEYSLLASTSQSSHVEDLIERSHRRYRRAKKKCS